MFCQFNHWNFLLKWVLSSICINLYFYKSLDSVIALKKKVYILQFIITKLLQVYLFVYIYRIEFIEFFHYFFFSLYQKTIMRSNLLYHFLFSFFCYSYYEKLKRKMSLRNIIRIEYIYIYNVIQSSIKNIL